MVCTYIDESTVTFTANPPDDQLKLMMRVLATPKVSNKGVNLENRL